MSKISIIVPVYNVKNYLKNCLETILTQTLKDIEIIIINDGSTDGCTEIINNFAEKDKRIKVIHKENRGYGHTCNLGLENATGEYIGIVEPDDFISSDMYEKLYELAIKTDSDIVSSNYYTVNPHINITTKYNDEKIEGQTYKNYELPEFIIGHSSIWTSIYRNSFIKKYNINFSETPGASFQDIGFNVKTWLYSNKIAITKNPYYYYRTDNVNSSIHRGNIMAFITIKEYEFLYNYIKKHNVDKNLQSIIDQKLFDSIIFNYDLRLIKKHFSFILKTSKLFKQTTKNNQEFKDSFIFKMIKNHPIIFYLGYLFKNPKFLGKKDLAKYNFKKFSKNNKIVLWGASNFIKDVIERQKNKQNILGFVDLNASLWGTKINSYSIYPPQELNKLKPDAVMLTILNKNKAIYMDLTEKFEKEYPNIKLLPNIFEHR